MSPSREVVELKRNRKPALFLALSHAFRYRREDRSVRVRTTAYSYQVGFDGGTQELFCWHWHPMTRATTHIHAAGTHPGHRDVHKLHVPSGRVSFEQVVRFLIEELGVTPQREDWDARLQAGEEHFHERRSWPGPHFAPSLDALFEEAVPGGVA